MNDDLVLALDIAPTVLDLAGGKAGTSSTSRACRSGRCRRAGNRRGWRSSFMCEYFSENAMPWLIGMSYKAIRTRAAQIHPLDAESLNGVECDELYDLERDPYEMKNLLGKRGAGPLVTRLRQQLAQLVANFGGPMKRRTLLAASLALPLAAHMRSNGRPVRSA